MFLLVLSEFVLIKFWLNNGLFINIVGITEDGTKVFKCASVYCFKFLKVNINLFCVLALFNMVKNVYELDFYVH